MRNRGPLAVSLLVIAMFSGCAGSGPKTPWPSERAEGTKPMGEPTPAADSPQYVEPSPIVAKAYPGVKLTADEHERVKNALESPLRIGMTRDELKRSRMSRLDSRISKTVTAAGYREQWSLVRYTFERAEPRYVYVENGVVVAWQDGTGGFVESEASREAFWAHARGG